MIRHRSLTTTLSATAAAGIAAVALVGCGGGGAAGGQASGATSDSATIALATTGLGRVLVNAQGRTLYLFKADHGSTSACATACAAGWPPLRASGKPTVGPGLQASAVTTIKRSDGQPQVSYHGHPLYTFAGDQKPGDTAGQGTVAFGAAWFGVTASGAQASGAASRSGTAAGY
jgi:predicted lipoprotein with Yx(FWY)xxD motif